MQSADINPTRQTGRKKSETNKQRCAEQYPARHAIMMAASTIA
jgi:uncharacterized protein Veg